MAFRGIRKKPQNRVSKVAPSVQKKSANTALAQDGPENPAVPGYEAAKLQSNEITYIGGHTTQLLSSYSCIDSHVEEHQVLCARMSAINSLSTWILQVPQLTLERQDSFLPLWNPPNSNICISISILIKHREEVSIQAERFRLVIIVEPHQESRRLRLIYELFPELLARSPKLDQVKEKPCNLSGRLLTALFLHTLRLPWTSGVLAES